MLVCLSVTNKHANISRTTEWIFTKFCTHILQKKSMSPKNVGVSMMTLGWINPEFDFFTIPLSPLKMQKSFQNLGPSAPWYTGSVLSQKKWSSNVLGSSGWHNPKILIQIYPSMLFSQEPAIGISKNYFPGKSVVKKTILS